MSLRKFDPAEFLDDEEEIEGYLQDAFETNDPAFIADALGVVSRAKGMAKISDDTGLGRTSLYKALNKDGNPEFHTILKVISSLGYKINISHE